MASTVQDQSRAPPSRKRQHANDDQTRESNHALNSVSQQPSKRHKSSVWPLFENDVQLAHTVSFSRPTLTGGLQRPSPGLRQTSKFQEGSLNDRPCQPPPAAFLEDEARLEAYLDNTRTHNAVEARTGSISSSEGSVSAKSSGIFRFGKAIANALKPNTIWQGVGGSRRDKHDSQKSKQITAHERRDDLFLVYEEMNAAAGSASLGRTDKQASLSSSEFKSYTTEDSNIKILRSGSSLGDSDSATAPSQWSREVGTSGEVPAAVETCDNARAVLLKHANDQSRTASMYDLKEAVTALDPVCDRKCLTSNYASSDLLLSAASLPSLHHQPSRKELARIKKLNKRVSDLESKLERARKELKNSVHTPPLISEVPSPFENRPFTIGPTSAMGDSDGSIAAEVLFAQPTAMGSATQGLGIEDCLMSPLRDHTASCSPVGHGARTAADTHRSREPTTNTSGGEHSNLAGKASIWRKVQIVSLSVPEAQKAEIEDESTLVVGPAASNGDSGQPKLRSAIKMTPTMIEIQHHNSEPCHTPADRPAAQSLAIDTNDSGRSDKEVFDWPRKVRFAESKKQGISPPPSSLASANKENVTHEIYDQENSPSQAESTRSCMKSVKPASPSPLQLAGSKAGNIMAKLSHKRNGTTSLLQQEDFIWDEDVF